jgi:hypothetical protein
MKLREWLLLISLLCLAPMASAHDGGASLDEAAGQPVSQNNVDCIDCSEPAGEDCTLVDCCSLCAAGISPGGPKISSAGKRESVDYPEAGAIVPAVLSPPFRPPIV